MLSPKGFWALVASYPALALAAIFFVYPPLLLSIFTVTTFLTLYMVMVHGRLKKIEGAAIPVERDVYPPLVAVGQPIHVNLKLTNRTQHTLSIAFADTHEGLEVIEGSSIAEAILQPGDLITVRYKLRPGLRGEYEIGPAIVRIYDARGLWLRKLTVGPASKVVVSLPTESWIKAGDSGLRSRIGAGGSGLNRLTGADDVFRGVRLYVEGDPVRRVAWKRTARDDDYELFLKQYEHYSSIKTLILLDCSYSMIVGEPTLLDICIMTSAALARAFLSKGDIVTVSTFGAENNITVRSESYAADYPTILKALSQVRPGGPYDAAALMNYLAPSDITIVLSRFAYLSADELAKLEKSLVKTSSKTLLIAPVLNVVADAPHPLKILSKLEEARLLGLRTAVPALNIFSADSLLPNIVNLYRLYSGGAGVS